MGPEVCVLFGAWRRDGRELSGVEGKPGERDAE
jgi:hypothetical protein